MDVHLQGKALAESGVGIASDLKLLVFCFVGFFFFLLFFFCFVFFISSRVIFFYYPNQEYHEAVT